MKPIQRNILLNPGPATTTDTVKEALLVPDICPREKEFCDLLIAVRKKLTRVIHGEETHSTVMFAASGTGAVEACISSLVGPNEKILIHTNGAYGKRMLEIARTLYPPEQIVVCEQAIGTYPDLNRISQILESDRKIKFLGFVHHETTTGMLNPAEALVSITKRLGVKLILDAMSSYAGLPIDLRKTPYDFVISSSNKCIQAMAGVSFVVCEKKALEQSRHHSPKSYYFNLWRQHQVFEETGQMQFTPPVQIFYALHRALDEFFEETAEKRFQRYADSWETLVNGLQKLQFKLLLPLEQHSKLLTAVIESEHPSFKFEKMHDALFNKGFTVYPGKIPANRTFRIANIGAIDKRDIENFLQELKFFLEKNSIL